MIGRNDIAATEILMLVAGLGIVSAVVFPILGYQRDKSRRDHCQGNLKSLTLALKQYTQDYNNRYPMAAGGSKIVAMAGQGSYGWVDALNPYAKTHAVFGCPAGRNFAATGKPWRSGYTDYFLNRRAAGRSDTAFPNSAYTILLGDGNDGDDISDARYSLPFIPPSWPDDPLSPMRRHREGANYSFVDGHVKWLRVKETPGTSPSKAQKFTFAP